MASSVFHQGHEPTAPADPRWILHDVWLASGTLDSTFPKGTPLDAVESTVEPYLHYCMPHRTLDSTTL